MKTGDLDTHGKPGVGRVPPHALRARWAGPLHSTLGPSSPWSGPPRSRDATAARSRGVTSGRKAGRRPGGSGDTGLLNHSTGWAHPYGNIGPPRLRHHPPKPNESSAHGASSANAASSDPISTRNVSNRTFSSPQRHRTPPDPAPRRRRPARPWPSVRRGGCGCRSIRCAPPHLSLGEAEPRRPGVQHGGRVGARPAAASLPEVDPTVKPRRWGERSRPQRPERSRSSRVTGGTG